MKKYPFASFILCGVFALSLPNLTLGKTPFAVRHPVDDKIDSLRERHDFLIDEFVEGKKCEWNKDRSRLIEVQLVEGDLRFPKDDLKLPDRTSEILGFFDFLVVRSEFDLKKVKRVRILDDSGRSKPLKVFGFKEGTLVFQLPKKINPKSSLSIAVSCEEQIEISEIAVRSKRGLDKEFSALKKWWLTFPKDGFAKVKQAFLEVTAKMNLEELNEALGENSEALGRIIVPARLPPSGEEISMWGILSDRRVAKIHEILSSMDGELAAEIAETSFDREFKTFREVWETAAIVPYQNNHAIESQLFLCSEFCSSDKVNSILDDWNEWYSQHKDANNYQFEVRAAPDALLVASIQTKMLMKKNNFSLEEVNLWLDRAMPLEMRSGEKPTVTLRWLMSSDSTPNRPDVIKQVPLFESHYQFMKRGSKQLLLDVLRAELE
jgi:hypothetical protein